MSSKSKNSKLTLRSIEPQLAGELNKALPKGNTPLPRESQKGYTVNSIVEEGLDILSSEAAVWGGLSLISPATLNSKLEQAYNSLKSTINSDRLDTRGIPYQQYSEVRFLFESSYFSFERNLRRTSPRADAMEIDSTILQYVLGDKAAFMLALSGLDGPRRDGEEVKVFPIAEKENLISAIQSKKTDYKTIAGMASKMASEGNLKGILEAIEHVRMQYHQKP